MTTHPQLRLAALLALAAMALAGCGQDAGAEAAPDARPAQAVDQGLRELLPAEVREAGVLEFATDASYAPASSFAPDGRTVVGFEPDLATALGEVLGVRVEMVVMEFDGTLEAVRSHEVDALMTAMTDTAEREEVVDFVNYFSAGSSIVVQRGNPAGVHDLGDLCGLVVAVEEATVQVDLVERTQRKCGPAPIDMKTFPTNDDALVEVRTGRAAAVLNDYPPAVHLTTDDRTSGDYQLASDVQYEPGLYGIGVAKDRPQLRDALQGALERLVATGTYERVLHDWDVQDGAVTNISVNGGRRFGS